MVGEHPDPLVRDEYMMVVADRLQLDSGLLRHRLAELTASPTRNLSVKVLDFVKLSGPKGTELRTFRWAVSI